MKYKEHYVDIIEDEVEKSHLWHLRCYTKKPENTATNFSSKQIKELETDVNNEKRNGKIFHRAIEIFGCT